MGRRSGGWGRRKAGATLSTTLMLVVALAVPVVLLLMSAAAPLVSASSTWTETSTADFADGIFENTEVGTDDVRLVGPVWTHVSSNWLPADVGTCAAPAFADVDGDGDFDLAVGDRDGLVEYFRNDAPFSGTYISSDLDTGENDTVITEVSWTVTGSTLTLEVAAGNTPNPSNWESVTNPDASASNHEHYQTSRDRGRARLPR